MKTRDPIFILVGLIAFSIAAPPGAELVVDDAVERIKEGALNRSLVMDHAFYLTDVTGPRLTGSPAFNIAAAWVRDRLTGYGLEHVRLERFPWPSTWTYSRAYAALVEPGFSPLIVSPMPWSPSTAGRVVADATLAPYADLDHPSEQGFTEFFRKADGTLRGKIVLLQEPVVPRLTDKVFARRFSDAELDQVAAPLPAAPTTSSRTPQDYARLNNLLVEAFDFLKRQGAKAVLWRASGEGGTAFATVLSTAFRERRGGAPLPIFFVAAEHYNRLARLLQHHLPVRVELELSAKTGPGDGINVLGEIPGRTKPSEIVIVGAHLDSWVAGTGATDNAAGCAIVIEAGRILRTLHLPIDRTVRFALWGGEEAAGVGARTYVRDHFGTREAPGPERDGLIAYFNMDNGTGRVRGVYTQGNEAVVPIFEAWLAPLRQLGVRTVTARRATIGSDDGAFVAAGLPGYPFIQDPLDYDTRTHHSNMDVYDRLQADDLKQAAAVVAAFAYSTATRAERLPR